MSRVSRAIFCCFSGFRCSSVRMLCRRSASLMMTTRTSVTMASSILRMVLRLVVFAVGKLDLVELGDAFDDVCDLLAENVWRSRRR